GGLPGPTADLSRPGRRQARGARAPGAGSGAVDGERAAAGDHEGHRHRAVRDAGGGAVMTGTTTHRIAVIPGDGIGKEVVPAACRVLERLGERHGFAFQWREFDWSCERYTRTGAMMPSDGVEQVADVDAIFLGAVGYPGVPDHVSLWGLLIPLRRGFAQYINLRPVKLLRGIESPLRGVEPGDLDFVVVRENNEGEYSEIGGRLYRGTEQEVAVQEAVFTRTGVTRVMRYAYELARSRRGRLASATKSNGIIHTMPFW